MIFLQSCHWGRSTWVNFTKSPTLAVKGGYADEIHIQLLENTDSTQTLKYQSH